MRSRSPSKHLAQLPNTILAGLVLLFLTGPIFLIVLLSFSQDKYITVDISGWTLEWYGDFLNSPRWTTALFNSFLIALAATALSTLLGAAAAIGLSHPRLPGRRVIEFVMIAPMIMPAVIIGVGMYFVFANLGITGTFLGVILAHTTLAVPFVVVATSASLATFDRKLLWASASLGGRPLFTFRHVMLPAIAPGIISGGLFAFATSMDEVVVTLFIAGPAQSTLPREMFAMIRDEMTPTILAGAGIFMLIAVAGLSFSQMLSRRS